MEFESKRQERECDAQRKKYSRQIQIQYSSHGLFLGALDNPNPNPIPIPNTQARENQTHSVSIRQQAETSNAAAGIPKVNPPAARASPIPPKDEIPAISSPCPES
jgi:hypothetical protein